MLSGLGWRNVLGCLLYWRYKFRKFICWSFRTYSWVGYVLTQDLISKNVSEQNQGPRPRCHLSNIAVRLATCLLKTIVRTTFFTLRNIWCSNLHCLTVHAYLQTEFKIEKWEHSSSLSLAATVVLQGLSAFAKFCVVCSDKTLTWKLTLCFRYKKGQKLTADEHLKLLQKETKHTLFIQKVCDKDAGLYVVRAKNLNGTISSSAILHVQGNRPPIARIDWIMLCVIYISVSLMYWLFTK